MLRLLVDTVYHLIKSIPRDIPFSANISNKTYFRYCNFNSEKPSVFGSVKYSLLLLLPSSFSLFKVKKSFRVTRATFIILWNVLPSNDPEGKASAFSGNFLITMETVLSEALFVNH